jgi:hypothetical protein
MGAETAAYVRLLVPALVGWVAWAVARAPYQERPNRLLASFLLAIAVEFLLETVWLLFQPVRSVGAARWAQFLLGLVDPPLLLAYALTFPRPSPRWRPWAYAAACAAVAAVLATALAVGHDRDLNFSSRAWGAAHLAAVGGAYLAAFLHLLRRFLGEPRRFLARQLAFVAVGTGFVALSRTAAAFQPGGLQLAGSHLEMAGRGAVLVLAAYAALVVVAWRWGRAALRSPVPLMAALGGLLAAFLGTWAALAQASPAGFSLFYALRWVFFALLVGAGILRHQIFDVPAETWNGLSYLAAAVAGVLTSAALDHALGAGAPAAGAAPRLAALAAGVAVLATAYPLLKALGRRLRRGRPAAPRRILLELYEATLEYAIAPGPPRTGAERQLAETLRELFEVSAEEHERVLARLRGG